MSTLMRMARSKAEQGGAAGPRDRAALGGIIGALLALPVVAAYPIVERIWLRESLGKNVLAEHARLEHERE
jgi:hypothetical protein